jgi:hypothetical protein
MRRFLLCLLALAALPSLPSLTRPPSSASSATPRASASPKAKLKLTNVRTGVEASAEADAAGAYQFLTVRAWPLQDRRRSRGFKTAVAQEFEVTVNARQRVDLQLEVGATTESVTINAAAQVLETDTSSRGTVVGTQQVVNLPLNGRAYADLALLAPGVRRSGIANSRDASFNVNGMRSSQNNFVVDGVAQQLLRHVKPGLLQSGRPDHPGRRPGVSPRNQQLLGRIRPRQAALSSTPPSAAAPTNSTPPSGSTCATPRSTPACFKPVNNQKPTLIQNQFGAAMGGALVENKMFVFGDYEGYRRVSRTITYATLPDLAMRQGNLGIPIRNPYAGEIYPNGVIPASAISRSAREILADLPAPNRAGSQARLASAITSNPSPAAPTRTTKATSATTSTSTTSGPPSPATATG